MLYQLNIDTSSAIPKYKQIVNSVVTGIERKTIGLNDKLPSINEVSIICDVSRDTVEKAYRELKQKGVINSVPGKGYFTTINRLRKQRKIFFLLNENNADEKVLFDSFSKRLAKDTFIDVHYYENDIANFESIIKNNNKHYTDFVIWPAFMGVNELRARDVINKNIPKDKLLLLNRSVEGITGIYKIVGQNFEENIYQSLLSIDCILHKYSRLELLFPSASRQPRSIIKGFQKFCLNQKIESKICFKNFEDQELKKGTLYMVVEDTNLFCMAEKIKASNLELGKDIGLIAYNDSLLKRKLLGGITTITTNYKAMAHSTAEMIVKGKIETFYCPREVILRNSL